jgi:hypothetical protein
MVKRYVSKMILMGIFSLLLLSGNVPASAQIEKPPEPSPPEIRIYRMNHQTASDVMRTIGPLLGQGGMIMNADSPRIAVDHQTNSLVIAANEKTHDIITALLQRLDVETQSPQDDKPAARDLMIRVVWLVDEALIAENQGATAIPPDIEETVEKLRKKFGLEPLVTAGQIVINQLVIDKTNFDGSGTAAIQETSEFKVRGAATVGDDQIARLEIALQTTSLKTKVGREFQQQLQRNRSPNPTCELSSVISAPIGRPVFFGMSPIDSKTSLFVVQVLDANDI